jgi:hypothetical protein
MNVLPVEYIFDAGRSIAQDAKLFPSDEELSQRVLFLALKITRGFCTRRLFDTIRCQLNLLLEVVRYWKRLFGEFARQSVASRWR